MAVLIAGAVHQVPNAGDHVVTGAEVVVVLGLRKGQGHFWIAVVFGCQDDGQWNVIASHGHVHGQFVHKFRRSAVCQCDQLQHRFHVATFIFRCPCPRDLCCAGASIDVVDAVGVGNFDI